MALEESYEMAAERARSAARPHAEIKIIQQLAACSGCMSSPLCGERCVVRRSTEAPRVIAVWPSGITEINGGHRAVPYRHHRSVEIGSWRHLGACEIHRLCRRASYNGARRGGRRALPPGSWRRARAG